MTPISRRGVLALIPGALAACSMSPQQAEAPKAMNFNPPLYPNETPELRRLINKWSDNYEVPRELVHRLAIRESTHTPEARNGPYYGLLQILPATARSMGFQGSAPELLNPDTNLRYGVKYLRGAWLVSDGSQDRAISWYAKGYYYEAKRRGMLIATGLRSA
ncbi:lytic transglycosylase domain-containing protein [Citreicella sp. C3M06]|uniref:lytic transglycosylase domain-containing protein n=1 Tax=Citreicella sp. C3M06 TaxID=2841564 RepID=UPI001C08C280|nr:lytic transglycosylase domain-containing protein [Citreicella sp. C3M06]MBU2960919.1 lytic transglycosylase domain-containing protein [Citreicella sp. C3M06]